jgi:hypothetical protein
MYRYGDPPRSTECVTPPSHFTDTAVAITAQNDQISRNLLTNLEEQLCRFETTRIQNFRSRLYAVACQEELDQ